MIKAIFFDLFFTLIDPIYFDENNEYDVLNITPEEWETYAEDIRLYNDRALGKVKSGIEILDRIAEIIPIPITVNEKNEILIRRENRMRNALISVRDEIINTLITLKDMNLKIGIISNADIIDKKYWYESPLAQYFDIAIFSCDVGLLKPDTRIYKYAIDKLNIKPSECIFVGDGGSNELAGAKEVGMKTVFSEFLQEKEAEKREYILNSADYYIKDFNQLLQYIK